MITAFLGIFAIMAFPISAPQSQDGLTMFGAATITLKDTQGNEMFTQTVHNQLFDAGEDFILDNTFTDLSDTADNVQIGAICLSAATPETDEGTTAATFNTNHDSAEGGDSTSENCKTDGTVSKSNQIATIGPLEFTAQDDNSGNWFAGGKITHIGICQATFNDADIRDCQTTLFAVVDTSDVTLADGETVDITYTFNLQSTGN